MIQVIYQPIERWPRVLKRQRKGSQFRIKSVDQAIRLLRKELEALGGVNQAVIQLAMRANDFRQDGLPKVHANVEHPGMIVSFERKVNRWDASKSKSITETVNLSFPCDTYYTWPDNLRAIALALEALRKVNRYGVTQSDEQYRGWTALPPPGQTAVRSTMDLTTASITLCGDGITGAMILEKPEYAKAAYRAKTLIHHPDRGGTNAGWQSISDAWEVIKRHHGL